MSVGVSLGVWVSERERQCLIETEPVGRVIYSLFRSSFPRVHSSLPSTRRHRAKPLLASPRWSNSSSLREGKGWPCLPQQVQRQLIFITSLWSPLPACHIFDVLPWLYRDDLFVLVLHMLGRRGKGKVSLWRISFGEGWTPVNVAKIRQQLYNKTFAPTHTQAVMITHWNTCRIVQTLTPTHAVKLTH